MLHDFDVGLQSHIDEIWLHGDYFEQGTQEIVDTAITDDVFELVEDFVHPPKEDLPIIRKPFDEKETLLNEVALFGIFSRSFSECDDFIEDVFGVVLIGDEDEQADGLIG